MSSEAGTDRPATTRGARALQNPCVRIVVALLFIAIPFAVVAAPFNMFVSDKSLKRLGALLLTAVVLGAYSGYVRIIEKRPVVELSRPRMLRELGAGVLLGAPLFSATVGLLAALGVLQSKLTGADWLAGGAFGAEGSIVAVAICVAAGLVLVATAVKKDNIVQPFWSAKSSMGPA